MPSSCQKSVKRDCERTRQIEALRKLRHPSRALRQNTQNYSTLSDIDDIGPARRNALMRRFKSLDKIKSATVDELMAAEGMNAAAAKNVYEFFHK